VCVRGAQQVSSIYLPPPNRGPLSSPATVVSPRVTLFSPSSSRVSRWKRGRKKGASYCVPLHELETVLFPFPSGKVTPAPTPFCKSTPSLFPNLFSDRKSSASQFQIFWSKTVQQLPVPIFLRQALMRLAVFSCLDFFPTIGFPPPPSYFPPPQFFFLYERDF